MKNTKILLSLFIISILMILTRGHSNWLSTTVHLPDFTISALFITGIYFRNWKIAVFLITLSIGIDNYAIFYKGVSANCITPAYTFLPLAYYIIFLSGRFLTSLNSPNSSPLPPIPLPVPGSSRRAPALRCGPRLRRT
jgi:hypothetical protein